MCKGRLIYERRHPERSQLYQTIASHWQTFKAERELEGRHIPKYIEAEFENYLRCGILAYGFGRIYCSTCESEKLLAFSCKGRGFCPSCGARRMDWASAAETSIYLADELIPLVPIRQFVVTFPPPLRLWLARSQELTAIVCRRVTDVLETHLRQKSCVPKGHFGSIVFIQRFGSGANLNIHLHIVALDGVYQTKSTGRLKFYNRAAPTEKTTTQLVSDIARRVNNYLLKKGYLEKQEDLIRVSNTEDIFAEKNDDLYLPAQAASVGLRIAFGSNAGKPIRRLRTESGLWPSEGDIEATSHACVTAGGYSVHTETSIKSHQLTRLEKLVRYMPRPAIADERLSLMDDGSIKLKLKSPWKDGTDSLLFSPLEFIEKLIALVPLPRGHMVRYYGAFAPASKHRNRLPDRPVPKEKLAQMDETPESKVHKSAKYRRGKQRATWANLLKRTFAIDVLQCGKCKGRMVLVGIVFDSKRIYDTLTGLGISPRAPPIAPPNPGGIFGYAYESYERPDKLFSHDW